MFQQVLHRSRLGSGKIRTHRFYESWRVKDGTFLPSSGEDYFLCPLSWHTEPGVACIVARAWFYPGDFLAIMKELDMCDPESPISGVLWSNPGTVPQKYDPGAHSVCRYWKATWAKTDTQESTQAQSNRRQAPASTKGGTHGRQAPEDSNGRTQMWMQS